MNPKKKVSVADVLLLIVAAIWGSSYALTKQATQGIPVLQFLALRFGITFVLLLPALATLRRREARAGLAAAALLGVNLFGIFVCETFGVTLTSAGNAAFLIGLYVALTPFVEWAMFGRRPGWPVFLAAGLSVVGAGLLASGSPIDRAMGRGDALIVAAALLRAVIVCLTRRLGGLRALPASTLTAVQSGVIAVSAGVLAWASGGATGLPWPNAPVFWFVMAWLIGACTVFAFFVQNHAGVRSSPSHVALLLGSEPLFGAIFAALWLGEHISVAGWIGGALIMASAALAKLRERGPSAATAMPASPPASTC